MENFVNFLNAISPLSEDANNAIIEKLIKQQFRKNHILVEELSTCAHLFFIEKGLARSFYFDDGREITDWFGIQNSIIGPVIRNFPMKDKPHSVELLEDSIIVSISFEDLEELYNRFHEIERLGRIIAIQAMVQLQNKLDSIQFCNAKQRYHDFVNFYPEIIQKASLGSIATYLGMNQVTLSRVRKK